MNKLNLQQLSSAVAWPTMSMGTSTHAFLAESLGLLPTRILQQDSEFLIHQAIEKEKIRLVRNIICLQQQQQQQHAPSPSVVSTVVSTSAASKLLVRPDQEPDSTTRVVDMIGSQIRTGEPYIDVTILPGIKQVEAVPPRSNRGGHLETFPQVRQTHVMHTYLRLLCCIFIQSFMHAHDLTHLYYIHLSFRSSTVCLRMLKTLKTLALFRSYLRGGPLSSTTLNASLKRFSQGISGMACGSPLRGSLVCTAFAESRVDPTMEPTTTNYS
jgi:hypothetical protein